MSEYDDVEEELFDKYEAQSNTSAAPVVSWKKSDKGDGFTGILLPADPLKRPDKGYAVRREYKQANPKENQLAGYTVWPPKNNVEDISRPVVESEFRKRWPEEDLSKARKVGQYHYTFETGLTDGSLLSGPFRERMAEMDPPVDLATITQRRIIEQGKSLTEEIEAALKTVGKKPVPGQTWAVSIDRKVPNEYGGETTIYKVSITPPTSETRAVVAAYVEAAKVKAAEEAAAIGEAEDAAAGEKYAGAESDAAEGPPPF
jgi:hypothetical protein